MIQAMKRAGFKPAIWVPVGCVLLSATLAWGAWNTLATADAVPEEKFEAHEQLDDRRPDRSEDKLDKIQETILDVVKEMKQ